MLGRAIWQYYQKRALAMVAHAVRWGVLPRPETAPCVHCGGPALIYEHRSYHKPLDVQPACDGCNHKLPPAMLDPVTVIDHLTGRAVFPYAADRIKHPNCWNCGRAHVPEFSSTAARTIKPQPAVQPVEIPVAVAVPIVLPVAAETVAEVVQVRANALQALNQATRDKLSKLINRIGD